MENLSIKLNLSKLRGASIAKLKGKSGQEKNCLVIPIEDASLFWGEKGVYLDITAYAYREPKYDQSHMLKQNLPKEVYDTLTEDERKALPIIGGVKTINFERYQVDGEYEQGADIADDLPF